MAVGPDFPLGSLLGEAQAAVSTSANALRDIRERYRSAHQADVIELEVLSAEVARNGNGRSGHKRDEAIASASLGEERSGLDRLDLALRSLEDAWVLLEPSDQTLRAGSPAAGASDTDLQMRILEAQEAERGRLAREVHDGPAQALSNAIFQVEVVERLLDRDERLARQELASLREILTRELRGVRAYLSQLRPPLLADLGLGGAIREAAGQIGSVLGVSVSVEVETEADDLPDSTQVVILRIVQEALQ
ncbi:MAG TPA: histidine kinase, partial [Candidatus Limnocylindrales bacterium]|nr:histidine kinase [Candidatus Limnocylindrales bacterium]